MGSSSETRRLASSSGAQSPTTAGATPAATGHAPKPGPLPGSGNDDDNDDRTLIIGGPQNGARSGGVRLNLASNRMAAYCSPGSLIGRFMPPYHQGNRISDSVKLGMSGPIPGSWGIRLHSGRVRPPAAPSNAGNPGSGRQAGADRGRSPTAREAPNPAKSKCDCPDRITNSQDAAFYVRYSVLPRYSWSVVHVQATTGRHLSPLWRGLHTLL
ncbi:MAG: hypothetical protein QOJ59_1710 [Thermomicrobiales bacterium]|nr:hypothetical protein [Thermomicrobiales bacterium]